ncbi:MAG: diguanylate cyclase [Elusimicrobia bacterium]|nr:diguanylate cyclase [Elusimicrobiota bacterium]MBP9699019.1 diguanylate cyclase [Elusimicrobiota bacterium]
MPSSLQTLTGSTTDRTNAAPDLPPVTKTLITELDAAVGDYMNWTRRVLRCVLLKTSPGEDVLERQGHNLCRFGRWFAVNRAQIESLDTAAAQQVGLVHRDMHDPVRLICSDALGGQPGNPVHLDAFEQSQSKLLALLAQVKTMILSHAVRIDPLTGLSQRYSIEHDFRLHQTDARRNGNLLYVGMIDVDCFKHINDHYGHPVGDRALRHLAQTMKRTLRENEPLYRLGGEEFLWLMKCKFPKEAELSGQRLLTAIRSSPVRLKDDQVLTLSITLGLAQVGKGEGLASAIKRSDDALYQAKHAGRDRYLIV